jgi:hypothetical protein
MSRRSVGYSGPVALPDTLAASEKESLMPVEPRRGCCARVSGGRRQDRAASAGWIDRLVVDRSGREVGTVVALYRGPHNAEPMWLGVDVGGFDAMRIVVAPVQRAHIDGERVVVAHDYEEIVSTPRVVVALLAEAIDNAG